MICHRREGQTERSTNLTATEALVMGQTEYFSDLSHG
jgi:hypothetical protein